MPFTIGAMRRILRRRRAVAERAQAAEHDAAVRRIVDQADGTGDPHRRGR